MKICGFGKQHPLLCGLLSEEKDRGLRNYATPILFSCALCPHCGYLFQRGFPVCPVPGDN